MRRPPSPLRIVEHRRTVGKIMVAVAAVGLVVALVGTVAAWQLAGRLNASTRSTLDVTIETIDSVEATIDLADQVLGATADTIDTAAATLNTVAASFDTATGVVEGIDDLTTEVGPSLDEAASIIRQLEGVGSGIDDVLGGLSAIPFGPDYDPERPLGETIGNLATEIEALPPEFARTSARFGEFAQSLGELETQVTDLAADVQVVNDELSGTDELIGLYRQNVADARAVAVDTRSGLDNDVTVMRIILLIGGVTVAVGQIVPYWIGRSLLDETNGDGGDGMPPDADGETGTKPETENSAG
jgi:hypothetical protein